MTFKFELARNLGAALLAVGLLASCGGATQIEDFSPRRVISFGDEASVINRDANQTKYTINGVVYVDPAATPLVIKNWDCGLNTIWIQDLAATFGMLFDECKGTLTGTQPSRTFAQAGATVGGVTAQIDQFVAGDSFNGNDLVTVMAGTNDVVAEYQNYAANTTLGTGPSVAAMEAAGTALGAQIVRLTDLGAKVLISTIPDVGLSPYGQAEEAANSGRSGVLSTMTKAFNTKLRLKLEEVRNGGRSVGLVLADDQILTMVRNPAAFALANVTTAACDPAKAAALTDCNPLTLKTDASVGTWLWAGDKWLGPVGHSRIGSLAITRARNNPF